MNIRINDKMIEIFSGARVRDALLKYSAREYHAVDEDKKQVTDKRGNRVDLDGELSDGQRLYIKKTTGTIKLAGIYKFNRIGMFILFQWEQLVKVYSSRASAYRLPAPRAIFVFVLLIVMASCAGGPDLVKTTPSPAVEETRIIIFHTNDTHAKIDNFAKIAWFVDQERKKNPQAHLFFLNAGDNFSGNPVVDQYEPKGEPVRQLMNHMGYDVMTLGNHEFDYGQKVLKNVMEKANYPILCANIRVEKGSFPQLQPFTILKTKNGIKIAVLGLLQVEKDSGIPSTHPDGLKGMTFLDPIETAKKYRYLKKESDVFIALTHLGTDGDELLAREMGELDLIIGGHSHTTIEHPTEINGVPVAQAGGDAKYLGRIEMILRNRRPVKTSGRLIEVAAIKEEVPKLKDMIAKFNDNPVLEQVIASLPRSPEGKFELGNLITDAVRKSYNLDIAFHNTGGIRTDRLEKKVKLKEIYTLHPFGNQVVVFKMTPAEIRSLIKYDYERHKGLDLKVSGIQYTISRSLNHKVKAIEMRDCGGQFLDENKTYTVGMNDYIGSTYKFTHRDPGKSLMVGVTDALLRYLKEGKEVCRGIDSLRTYERIVIGDTANLTRLGETQVKITAGDNPFLGSTSAGNLMADAVRAATGADIALYPSSLQRQGLIIPASSPFYREYISNLYRFSHRNKVVTGQIKGKDLTGLILVRSRYKNNADLQVSGITYTIYLDRAGNVTSVDCYLPGGGKISASAVYTVSFNDYDFKNYYKLDTKVLNRSLSKQTAQKMLIDYIKARGTISSSIGEKRIKMIKK